MDDQRIDSAGVSGVRRRGIRISLKSLLAIISLIAAMLGTYAAGYNKGNRVGFQHGVDAVSLEYQTAIMRAEKLREK